METVLTKPIDTASLTAAELLQTASEATVKATRAWMLRLLRWGAGASNLGSLTSLLTQVGVRQTRGFVQAQGQWLAQNGYVETRMFDKTVVYELTRLGDEVARGLVLDPGIEAIQLADVEDDEFVMNSLRSR